MWWFDDWDDFEEQVIAGSEMGSRQSRAHHRQSNGDTRLTLGTIPGITRKLHLSAPDPEHDLTCYASLFWRDGKPDQIQLACNKQGSVERGLLHVLADIVTLALRQGVPMAAVKALALRHDIPMEEVTALPQGIPLESITAQLKGTNFEPGGVTGSPDIPMASSIADYLGKWLDKAQPT